MGWWWRGIKRSMEIKNSNSTLSKLVKEGWLTVEDIAYENDFDYNMYNCLFDYCGWRKD